MKQILVSGVVNYPTLEHGYDLTSIAKGAIGAFKLNDTVDLLNGSAPADKNFQIVLGRGANVAPFIIPEVDVKTLSVVKMIPSAGNEFGVSIACPGHTTPVNTPTSYTFVLIKRGTVFNERNKWTFDVTVAPNKTITAANMAFEFNKIINAEIENIGLTSAYTEAGGLVTLKSTTNDFDIQFVSGFTNTLSEITGSTALSSNKIKHLVPAVGDKAYVEDLVQRCIAGKGIKYLGDDGKEIYPGYPEAIADVNYVVYTLRFAVPRASAKQRDEVVYQTVHIAVPVTVENATSKWDVILGLTAPAAAANLDED